MTALFRTALVLTAALSLFATPALAEEESIEKEGTFIHTLQEFPNCRVDTLKLKYHIKEESGAPHVSAAFQWQANKESAPDCLPKDVKIALQMFSRSGHVKNINFQPEILKSGEGYGKPDANVRKWDKLLCGWGREDVNDCFSEDEAKKFLKSGYKVVGFYVWR
ncbi:hypothetical protein [Nitrospina gracilis]|uniref:hypothetical protein n=1 Tax=Nitrospina gracilis TaxID=35801 RepID=UPI001F32A857|nr:hypothetical protein [Nitrospina gracilis]MCF8721770.1 hypothetical protein [Nitrospina gracilis Nb-211]